VWVLGSLAKRWTAALQPKGFDSPVLLSDRPTKIELGMISSAQVILTSAHANDSLKMLGKRAQIKHCELTRAPPTRGFLLVHSPEVRLWQKVNEMPRQSLLHHAVVPADGLHVEEDEDYPLARTTQVSRRFPRLGEPRHTKALSKIISRCSKLLTA
jgi:hypothetical protein